jgi:hypothetical protein
MVNCKWLADSKKEEQGTERGRLCRQQATSNKQYFSITKQKSHYMRGIKIEHVSWCQWWGQSTLRRDNCPHHWHMEHHKLWLVSPCLDGQYNNSFAVWYAHSTKPKRMWRKAEYTNARSNFFGKVLQASWRCVEYQQIIWKKYIRSHAHYRFILLWHISNFTYIVHQVDSL